MTRFWHWLRRSKTPSVIERDKASFDREHAQRLEEAARLRARQREVERRFRALGFEVDVVQHNRGEKG